MTQNYVAAKRRPWLAYLQFYAAISGLYYLQKETIICIMIAVMQTAFFQCTIPNGFTKPSPSHSSLIYTVEVPVFCHKRHNENIRNSRTSNALFAIPNFQEFSTSLAKYRNIFYHSQMNNFTFCWHVYSHHHRNNLKATDKGPQLDKFIP